MADACIVCLGDLATHDPETNQHVAQGKSSVAPNEDELIAHLLPCGHNLHDSCLKPWVERANSCPICRASFNMVQISGYLNGPILDSYAVQDKVQAPVEDNAPSAIIDDEGSDEHVDPCMICETYGDEGQLLLCDGCNQSCHVFCAGLDDIPAGAWFCYTCQEDAQVMHENYQPRPVARHATARQRLRERRPDTSTTWARLWRSVAHRTGIDLEHPFDEDGTRVSQFTPAPLGEVREWQRRFEVAAHVAGASAANRFRELAPPSRPQLERDRESQEEIRAWNAFEKARLIQDDDHTRGRRKRRSRDSSPELEAPPAMERRRKRPRTLLVQDSEQPATAGESSRSARTSISAARPDRTENTHVPTFLQSLLDEVESHTPAQSLSDALDTNNDYTYGLDHGSSPDGSPCASPRSMSPSLSRPGSPGLTTQIEPIFPPAPAFTPDSPTTEDSVERARSRQRNFLARQSPGSSPVRQNDIAIPPPPPPPPPEEEEILGAEREALKISIKTENPAATPSPKPKRTTLDLPTKTQIQTLVKTVLKPLYKSASLTSDQYTTINRDVSRKLYDRIGSNERFVSDRDKWSKVAKDEVFNAVKALKTGSSSAGSSSENDGTDGNGGEGLANLPLRGVEAS